jgi:serine/threonine protein kinase
MQTDDLLTNVIEVAGSKILPPCVLTDLLGRGGMGAVYRAHHLNLAIDVAVKVMKPQLVADDPQFVARFKREGQSAASISHQNVIRVFDVDEYAGLHFLIMELVVGETARQRVARKGPLPVPEALQIVHDAAMGLGAAHALGIVHRDVKPDNLLIANSGQLKVADLGLAKPTMGGGSGSLMSTANQVMGTPAYMPPEQWESPAVGPTADVWALGATLWFLLAGEEAFDARDGNFPRVMKQIVLQPFPDLRKKRSDVPDGVHAVLAKATAKEPKDRYADGNELATAIAALGVPRASLRDVAGVSDARTLVSTPIKELDKIKQWLREENLARKTPSKPRLDAVTMPQSGPLAASNTQPGTPPPTTPGAMPRVASPARARAIVIASFVVAIAAAALWLAFGPRPTASPVRTGGAEQASPAAPEDAFADVVRLAGTGNLAEAIAAYGKLVAARPPLRDDARLAALHVQYADRLAAGAAWKDALEQMRLAADLDTGLAARRSALRDRVKVAANAAREVEGPRGPVAPGSNSFVIRLDVDAVDKLRLGDQPFVKRNETGKFVQTLRVASAGDVPVAIELTDGHIDTLAPVRIELATGLRPLTFRRSPAPTNARILGGVAVTDRATIEVSGEVSEDGAELLCGTEPVAGVRWDQGRFACELPIAATDTENTLALRARKNGCTEATGELRVARLRAVPTFELTEPTAAFATEAARIVVAIRASRWTQSASVRAGGGQTELTAVAETPGAFRGEVRLVRGDNTLEVVVKDVLGRESAPRSIAGRCTLEPAAILEVALDKDGSTQQLAANQRIWIKTPGGTLRAKANSALATLRVNDTALAAGTGVDLADLREGVRKQFAFRAANDLGASNEYTVTIGLDSTPPTIAITAPPAGVAVATDLPLTIRGTWEDVNGPPSILIAGRAATVENRTEHSGIWSLRLDGQRESRPIRVRATDSLGNSRDVSYPIDVDPALRDRLVRFAGFTNDAALVNQAGYGKRIFDDATGIELVAVDFPVNAAPKLYVARDLVSERQFDGKGGDAPKVGLSGKDINTWLGRNRRFDLLDPSEWVKSMDEPDLRNMATGPVEWLKPPTPKAANWPLCKDPAHKDAKSNDSTGARGFRVVFRVP